MFSVTTYGPATSVSGTPSVTVVAPILYGSNVASVAVPSVFGSTICLRTVISPSSLLVKIQ